jgi:hypothetical protein
MELVLRFLTFRTMSQSAFTRLGDLGYFLTYNINTLAIEKGFNRKSEEEAFRTTFALLAAELDSDRFRRWLLYISI